MEPERGLIHIYCGFGKGKTSAAFGLGLRCAGHGQQVLILQFLKGWDSGEIRTISKIPGMHIFRGDTSSKFAFQMSDAEKISVREKHDSNLREVSSLLATGNYRMLILDEIMDAWQLDLVDRNAVLELLRTRPKHVEVVMTGHQTPSELYDLADYISEIQKVRHPYDSGIPARRCIEF